MKGWSTIMYCFMGAYSEWVWIYFVVFMLIGWGFASKLFLITISAQFSMTQMRVTALDKVIQQKKGEV